MEMQIGRFPESTYVIHRTEGVRECLGDCGFTRMNHPAPSPDVAPSDFFLFGAMKESLSGMHWGSLNELFQEVERFLNGLSIE
jgi:hypothetical protein